MGLSVALDIERIALAEVRLLHQARSGDSKARADLISPYAPGLWTVCVATYPNPADRDSAWDAFLDTLEEAMPGFHVDKPVGVQLFAHLWHCLTLGITHRATPDSEPAPVARDLPRRPDAEDQRRVYEAVHALSPSDRIVWAFVTVTGLETDRLAEFTGAGQSALRSAYARASWAVYRALTR